MKPESLQRYEGQTQSLLPHNPQPNGYPVRPLHLGQHGSKLWDDLIPQLFKLGLVSEVDASQLEGLCFWWQSYKELSAAFTECSKPEDSTKLFYMVRSSWQEFSRLGKQFGLSALARTAINLTDNKQDSLEEYES